MSAGFKLRDKIFWGTNGSIEVYVAAMAEQASLLFGHDAAIAAFFRGKLACFFSGTVITLDPMLDGIGARERFLVVLDAATQDLDQKDTFSEIGREWVHDTIGELRRHIIS